MHVVGLAVELHQLDIQFGTNAAHGVFTVCEHGVGEHRPAILGHEYKVRM